MPADRFTCLWATDANFLPYTALSIASLLARASVPVGVCVLTADIPDDQVGLARNYLGSRGIDAAFIALPAQSFQGLPRPQSLPLSTYGRLFMHRLLPQSLDRVLYVDGDTLVGIDVAPLAERALNGKAIGAVIDIGRILVGRREEAQIRLDLGPDGDYFNAGVLLVDWQRWCADAIGERCLHALATEPERFVQKDQCALNYVCRDNWVAIERVWNYQPADMLYGRENAAVLHFLGGRKPWSTQAVRHPMRFVQRYGALLSESPWGARFERPALPYGLLEAMRITRLAVSPRHWRRAVAYRAYVAAHPDGR